MAIDIQMKQKSEKRFPKFTNFGEYLFWSYANLQIHFRYSSFQLRLYSTFWHSFAVILLIFRLQSYTIYRETRL